MSETKRQRGRPRSTFLSEVGDPYQYNDNEASERDFNRLTSESMERRRKRNSSSYENEEVQEVRTQFVGPDGNTYFKSKTNKLVYTSHGEEVGRFSGNIIKFF
jgi:hypothetical protein